MHVAVQGCSHGSLTAIYDSIAEYETVKGRKVDLLLLCGDFQALRNTFDFDSLAVPPKYHALGTFHQYYSGERVAPVLTLVIGGNHEASNYMWELYHGGWLAPNIYYLGAAGSVLVDGLRVVGASGIYKSHDYRKGHFEKVPFDRSTLRSVYHVREYDIVKLLLLPQSHPTVVLSHDWPTTIAKHGNTGALLRRKPFFKSEVNSDTLGSPPLLDLLKHIQPDFWFSAHLHVKFAAVYEHTTSTITPVPVSTILAASAPVESNPDEIAISDDEVDTPAEAVANPDEIAISDDEEVPEQAAAAEATSNLADASEVINDPPAAEVLPSTSNPEEIAISDDDFDDAPPAAPASAPPSSLPSLQPGVTRFLALDKCGPGKDFIQFLDIPSQSASPNGPKLTFDPHWLAISRALHPYLSTQVYPGPLPEEPILAALVEDELARIETEGLLVPGLDIPLLSEAENQHAHPPLVMERGPIEVCRVQQFWPTAPPHGKGGGPGEWYTNGQTEAWCGMLGLENKVNPRPQ